VSGRRDIMIEKIRVLFPEYKVDLLKKGWSLDKKYLLTGSNGKFTLRISEKKSLEKQMEEYNAISSIDSVDQMIRPVSYGTVDELHSYIIYNYIDGRDLKEVIRGLDSMLQYDLGIQAGIALRKIHEVEKPDFEDVRSRYNRKITDKINAYREGTVKMEKLEVYIPFLTENRHLLDERPTVLLHGDYHLGNMIIRDEKVYIIDFNRYDFGDPYEEFDRMTMNSSFSPQFSKGLLHGYFKGVPPMDFWWLLKLYAITNAVGSIPWAEKYSPDSMDFLFKMIDNTLDDYVDTSTPIPDWYKKLIGWYE
jgi:aminoglycoside phosphotransferase (APT) family kinase protein